MVFHHYNCKRLSRRSDELFRTALKNSFIVIGKILSDVHCHVIHAVFNKLTCEGHDVIFFPKNREDLPVVSYERNERCFSSMV